MRKEVRKLAYLSKETAKSILSEFMEGFLYLLYISSSPLSTAFLGDLLKDYHYSLSSPDAVEKITSTGINFPNREEGFFFC
ncbi:MAG: hypothetical protein J7K37_00190 [Candidatus Omnitrophica bacterium]|nr:hypothetical protein [Candidatus Omnitrophota bacterium]